MTSTISFRELQHCARSFSMLSKPYYVNKLLILCTAFFVFVAIPFNGQSAEGDTTVVEAHRNVDMTWYGNYDKWAVFPKKNKSYHKILMYYTMGCSSSGCSDWDYTTKIELLKPTGKMDSNISNIDTISTNPVVADTTWNKFEVKEPFELGRVITPYGGYMAQGQNGFSNSWQHTYVFDVTEFAPLLHDSLEIRAFYGGWSDGFSVSLRFEMIEGTPPRDVLSITNIWRSGGDGWSYDNPSTFNNDHLSQEKAWISQDAKAASLRVIPTGHGFDNNVNCAEFCKKNYSIEADGQQIADQLMWRSDCGRNPVYPQGGTWLYDRANWWPGDRATIYRHKLGNAFAPGNWVDLNMSIDPINWSGSDAPEYIIDAQLFTYGAPNFKLDASLEEIIAPPSTDRFARKNPICTNPIVKIRNTGEDTLKSLLFSYGVKGGDTCQYRWNGNLAFMEEQQVELPLFNWTGLDTSDKVFHVSISAPNYSQDGYDLNNHLTSTYQIPPVYDSTIILAFSTNGAAQESAYSLLNQEGTAIYSRDSFQDNQMYRDTFDLSPGRYVLQMTDRAEDGIDFFANNDGSGSLRFQDTDQNTIKYFQGDFGTSITHHFTVGYRLGEGPADQECKTDLRAANRHTHDAHMEIYPNPTSGNFRLHTHFEQADNGTLLVIDPMGRQLMERSLPDNKNGPISINGSDLRNGLYFVIVRTKRHTLSKRLIVER